MPIEHAVDAIHELEKAEGGPTDPSHDARLRRGIIDTAVSRPIAATLVIGFLLFVYGLPLSQAFIEKSEGDDSSALVIFERAPSKANLREFEHELEQASYAKAYVQPRVQALLSRFGRVGNKRAVIGHEGLLYYTPGLTHLSGPSFLDPDVIAEREREAKEGDDATFIHADPRPAIFDFQAALARRGIKLVLFPVPDKIMLQPRELSRRVQTGRGGEVPRNAGWDQFVRELHAHGVLLFDPTPPRLSPRAPTRFLVQDTHWTPHYMEDVADELAACVTRVANLPPAPTVNPWHAKSVTVERVGDLVDMLKLPEDQTVFRPQTVTIHPITGANGEAWEPNSASDVLLLGDSFTNVFSLDAMGWGEAAGLGPQLSLALGRGVDVIAQNDSGAFATRQALARELSAGNDRLAGKRVVVWEFAVRELSVGDWKPIALPDPARGATR